MAHVHITREERKAIESLKRLAKKWPRTLMLFSWSGSLVVSKEGSEGIHIVVSGIKGIPNDGGDPGREEMDQFGKVTFED